MPPTSRSQCLYRPGRVSCSPDSGWTRDCREATALGDTDVPDQRPPERASRMGQPHRCGVGHSALLPNIALLSSLHRNSGCTTPGAGPDRASPQAGSRVCKCQQKSSPALVLSRFPLSPTVCLFSKDKGATGVRESTRRLRCALPPQGSPWEAPERLLRPRTPGALMYPSKQISTSESPAKGHTFKTPAPQEEVGFPTPDTLVFQARLTCLGRPG